MSEEGSASLKDFRNGRRFEYMKNMRIVSKSEGQREGVSISIYAEWAKSWVWKFRRGKTEMRPAVDENGEGNE